MTDKTFEDEFKKLEAWFRKKHDAATLELWKEKLIHIPDRAFRQIISQTCDTAKYMPVPQDLKNAYLEWLESNPAHKADYVRTWCPSCNGTGILSVSFTANGGLEYEASCRCASCTNWEGRVGTWCPAFYRQDLERNPKYTVITRREREDGEGYVDMPRVVVHPQKRIAGTAMHVTKALPELQPEIDF